MGDIKTLYFVQCKLSGVKKIWIQISTVYPQQTTRCNFGLPPGISRPSTTSLFGFRFANEGNSLITASLAIFVEDVSLVYVAHGGVIEVVSFNKFCDCQGLVWIFCSIKWRPPIPIVQLVFQCKLLKEWSQ